MEHVDGRGDMDGVADINGVTGKGYDWGMEDVDGVADINGARGGKYGWCPGQEIWVGNEEYGIRF